MPLRQRLPQLYDRSTDGKGAAGLSSARSQHPMTKADSRGIAQHGQFRSGKYIYYNIYKFGPSSHSRFEHVKLADWNHAEGTTQIKFV